MCTVYIFVNFFLWKGSKKTSPSLSLWSYKNVLSHKCLSNQWKRRIINDTSSNQTSSKSSGKSQNPVRSWLIASFCLQIYLNVISVKDFLKRLECHVWNWCEKVFAENSKSTSGNKLIQKEIENCFNLRLAVSKYNNKVSDTMNRLQMKSIKFEEIYYNLVHSPFLFSRITLFP